LPKEEIDKLKQDAEKFAEDDKKKKESVDIKNEAESFVYTTEKLLTQDLKDKLTQEQGIKISESVKELKEVLDKTPEEIKPKLEALKALVNQITTELYKNVQQPPQQEQQSSGPSEQNTQNPGPTN